MRNLIITVGTFVLLALVAIAGWVRTPNSTAAALLPQNNCLDPAAMPVAWAPVYANGQIMPAAYYQQPGVTRTVYVQEPARVQRVVTQRQNVAARTVVKRQRPFGHSVAIVGGGAGAGAAIGALAGGGKGAAIGALSGGAAGFIYDRLTHNR